jgi:hypothetical protein
MFFCSLNYLCACLIHSYKESYLNSDVVIWQYFNFFKGLFKSYLHFSIVSWSATCLLYGGLN